MKKYRIILKGHIEPGWSTWFGDVSIHYDKSDNSVVTGFLPDQSALHGMLEKIRDLNLTLLSVQDCGDEPEEENDKEI